MTPDSRQKSDQWTASARHAFADDLCHAGFYSVSNDIRAGRRTAAWALEHVAVRAQPSGPWGRAGQEKAQAVLDKWREALNGGEAEKPRACCNVLDASLQPCADCPEDWNGGDHA